jgi:NTE family protein
MVGFSDNFSVIPDLGLTGKPDRREMATRGKDTCAMPSSRRKPWALALGGGSARGFAHIGVLKVLESHDIRPDMVTGTSMGAVIGALHAAGYAASDVERLALDLEPRRLLYLAGPRPSKSAMFDLRGLEALLRDLLPVDFGSLEIPFACVSTDLTIGEPVLHREGDLVGAIRASISVPVAFTPFREDGRVLVDGGLVEPVPVDAARALGARGVVAVTVSTIHSRPPDSESRSRRSIGAALQDPRGRWQIAAASVDVMERQLAAFALTRADVVVAPKVEAYSQLSFFDAAALIALGEAAAADALTDIRNLVR